jgi:hypothetical protein
MLYSVVRYNQSTLSSSEPCLLSKNSRAIQWPKPWIFVPLYRKWPPGLMYLCLLDHAWATVLSGNVRDIKLLLQIAVAVTVFSRKTVPPCNNNYTQPKKQFCCVIAIDYVLPMTFSIVAQFKWFFEAKYLHRKIGRPLLYLHTIGCLTCSSFSVFPV